MSDFELDLAALRKIVDNEPNPTRRLCASRALDRLTTPRDSLALKAEEIWELVHAGPDYKGRPAEILHWAMDHMGD